MSVVLTHPRKIRENCDAEGELRTFHKLREHSLFLASQDLSLPEGIDSYSPDPVGRGRGVTGWRDTKFTAGYLLRCCVCVCVCGVQADKEMCP